VAARPSSERKSGNEAARHALCPSIHGIFGSPWKTVSG
jgi:hypothetical protein